MSVYKPDTLITLFKEFRTGEESWVAVTAIGACPASAPGYLLSERALIHTLVVEQELRFVIDPGFPKIHSEILAWTPDPLPESLTIRCGDATVQCPLPADPAARVGACLPNWEDLFSLMATIPTHENTGEPQQLGGIADWSLFNGARPALQFEGRFQPDAPLQWGAAPETRVTGIQVFGFGVCDPMSDSCPNLIQAAIDTIWFFPSLDLNLFVWRAFDKVDPLHPKTDLVLFTEEPGAPIQEPSFYYDRWRTNPGTPAVRSTWNASLLPIFAPDLKTPLVEIFTSTPIPEGLFFDPAGLETEYARLAEELGTDPSAGIPEPAVELSAADMSAPDIIAKLRANGIHDAGLEARLLDAEMTTKKNNAMIAAIDKQIELLQGS